MIVEWDLDYRSATLAALTPAPAVSHFWKHAVQQPRPWAGTLFTFFRHAAAAPRGGARAGVSSSKPAQANGPGAGGLGPAGGFVLGGAAAVDPPPAAVGDPADLLHIDVDQRPRMVMLVALRGTTGRADHSAGDRVQFPQ